MRDILSDIDLWLTQNESIGLATVTQTWGSAPRGLGAKMAFTLDGKITGSVSGGCVEGQVFQIGTEVITSGIPQLFHFGVADETAWEVGLACGGNIQIFVKQLDPDFYAVLRANLLESFPLAIVTVVKGPASLIGCEVLYVEDERIHGTMGERLDNISAEITHAAMDEGRSQQVTLEPEAKDSTGLFVEVILPPPTLVIVGGVHIAIALAAIAKTLGYRTVIIDPRRAFGNAARFPEADQLIQDWPEQAFDQVGITKMTSVVILTHDPKIDDMALVIALKSPAFYIGALGSRKSQGKRLQRLTAKGLTVAQLSRLHGPIGVDIGGKTPEEIALAVMAEIVAVRHRRVVSSSQY